MVIKLTHASSGRAPCGWVALFQHVYTGDGGVAGRQGIGALGRGPRRSHTVGEQGRGRVSKLICKIKKEVNTPGSSSSHSIVATPRPRCIPPAS